MVMKASIISIGTEILIGQIINTNASWMGAELNTIGVEVREVISVSDEKNSMLQALEDAENRSEIILVTGGLGPTKDDFTKDVIAEFIDVPLYFDESTYERITNVFKKKNFTLSEQHKEQCWMPEGVQLLENRMGTAPGMLFKTPQGKLLISMPGVPFEMKYIFKHSVIPLLSKMSKIRIYHQTIMTVGTAESIIANMIEDIEENLPKGLSIAYLPSFGKVRVRVSGQGDKGKEVENNVDLLVNTIKERLGDMVYGMNELSLAEAVQRLAIKKNIQLGTAESCTGGFVAHTITKIPGCSQYFKGSVIAYNNDIKSTILGVEEIVLENKGAVSEEVAKQMVKGLLDKFNVDIALSITGIAGPGGGSELKPIGTVFMACGNKKKMVFFEHHFGKNRMINIQYSTVFALNMVRKFLLEV